MTVVVSVNYSYIILLYYMVLQCIAGTLQAADTYYIIGGVVAMIILIISLCLAATIIILIRAKAKQKAKLEQSEDSESKIYEEINQISQSNMDTADNVAYVSCQTLFVHTSKGQLFFDT